MKKVLVTGANGFIGSNLVKRLIAEGYIVHSLVRKTSDLTFLQGQNTVLFYGDINDAASLKAPLEGVDLVYHLAGLAADWGAYAKFEKVNLEGTQTVVQAAERAGVKKLVYISTVAFHGFGQTNMTEDMPPGKHLIPYAQTKYLAEKWVLDFGQKSKMAVTAVRPGNVYGENDRTFMAKYIEALESGKFSQIGKGKSKTCPVFVDNLVDILYLVGHDDRANGEAFLATDGLDITWQQFNTELAQALGIPLPKTSMPFGFALVVAKIYYGIHRLLGLKSEPFLTPYRIRNGGLDYHFSIEKLKRYFDYQPKIGLKEGLKRTVAWYRNR